MKKLKSQNGASISFALLLFLVCATAGAVVLAAGTAAAGRLSQMVNMDKRYYSASSAAALLAKEIEGKKVTIVRSRVEKVTKITTYNESGTQTDQEEKYKLKYETIVNELKEVKDIPEASDRPDSEGNSTEIFWTSFLTKQACYLMFEDGNCNTDAALNRSFGLSSAKEPMQLTLTGVGESLAALNITGTATLNIDGSIEFEIGSTVDKDTYTLILRLNPVINESSSSSMTSDPPSYSYGAGGGFTETLTTTETTTITSTISWDVESIQKKVSDFKPTPSGTP